MNSHLIYNKNNLYGIRSLRAGTQKHINVIAGDIETKPFMLLGIEKSVRETSKENIFKDFLDLVDVNTQAENANYLFFHNLKFDMQVILYKYKTKFFDNTFEIYLDRNYNEISYAEYLLNKWNSIKIKVFATNTAAIFINFYNRKRVSVLDSFAFFKESLANICKRFNFQNQKTKGWSDEYSKEELKKYLEKDLLCQKELSTLIIDFHRKYDVRITMSIAALSAKIYRKHFIKKNEYLSFPNMFLMQEIEHSYHGGKNKYYFSKVKKIRNVREYDIISAYPNAMTKIPSFDKCFFKITRKFEENSDGIYCFSGKLRKNKYQIFFNHDFSELKSNKKYLEVKNLCVTSYELRTAVKHAIIQDCDELYGILVVENKETGHSLKNFSNHFFQLKNTTSNIIEREFYKIILNSLYGKFAQKKSNNSVDVILRENRVIEFVEKTYTSSLTTNIMIASLITGFVRAEIFELEMKYNSVHTSTDSIKTRFIISEKQELGGLKLECFGDILLLRNKCYIHFAHTIKKAHHGFYARTRKWNGEKSDNAVIENMIYMYIEKKTDYEYERMGHIRESLRRQNQIINVCDFNKIKSHFNVRY